MNRASLGKGALAGTWGRAVGTSLGVAALALAPLALVPPAGAAGSAGAAEGRSPSTAAQQRHRPDKSFGPQQRRAAIAQARKHRERTKDALRLGNREGLVVKDVVRDSDGGQHVRYERTYAGLPVIGGDLVVHETDYRTPSGVEWATQRRVAVRSTKATVSPQQAAHRSARATSLEDGRSSPRKVVYAVRHEPVLAWESTVSGTSKDGDPVEDLVYTDARTGELLGTEPLVKHAQGTGYSQWSGTVGLQTTLSGSTYQLIDNTRGGHQTNDANNSTSQTAPGTLFTDSDNVWGNGSSSSRQTAAVDAHYGAAVTWDLYQDLFGRTGIRGDGQAAYSRVHYGNNYENAFWYDPCFCMTYGDGGSTLNALTALDIAGHEMSHGLTSSTAGLVYSGDAGGLNESTSDVMGTMVEFKAGNSADPGDYYIGEKVFKSGGWLRRMDDPDADGASVSCWSSSTKNLDPHYSSGVGNHAFYLMAEGTGTKTIGGRTHSSTTCNGTSVTGMGRDAAAKIWYRALSVYMTSTTSYPQAAGYMVRAAKDLYGAESAQCSTTLAAWRGVNTSTGETCGGSTPPPSGDNLLANPGFESGSASWTATSGAVTSSSGGVPHSGSWYAWLDGYGSSHTDYVQQSVTVPSASAATLGFYLYVATDETTSSYAYDTLRVQVVSGGSTYTLATYSNLDESNGYVHKSVDLSAFTGRTVTVKFLGVEDYTLGTSFLVDDTELTVG